MTHLPTKNLPMPRKPRRKQVKHSYRQAERQAHTGKQQMEEIYKSYTSSAQQIDSAMLGNTGLYRRENEGKL